MLNTEVPVLFSSLRDPYIISQLCSKFDYKYFATKYTNKEYRKARFSEGFGYARLFKYAFLKGINVHTFFSDNYVWLRSYLVKCVAVQPETLIHFIVTDYYPVLDKAFDDRKIKYFVECSKRVHGDNTEQYFTIDQI